MEQEGFEIETGGGVLITIFLKLLFWRRRRWK
jgi:hypothetical protein